MIDTFDLIKAGAVLPLEAIGAGSALQSPYVGMGDMGYIDFIIRLADAANEPVLTFQQAKDAAGADVKALPISHVAIFAAADVDASPAFLQDESVNRSARATTYTPAGNFATASLEAIIHVRFHEGEFDEDFTHVRCNTPAITGRAATMFIIGKDKFRKGQDTPGLT